MASTILQRTLGTPTNKKKLTASMWLKKSFNGAEKHFFGIGTSGGYLDFRFASTDELELYHYNSGYNFRLTTTRKFRDNNAWYHLVFTIDTSLATADDRFKVYVNGVQETVFTNRTNPSQNYELSANVSGNTINVGNYRSGGNSFDGLMSHVHFSDGYAYTPSSFGETDSTTGEWKIKTSVTGVTYGTNGFWWLKDSIATTDHSPNSNTFTVASGTLTKTEDNPSNVFATGNFLIGVNSNGNALAPSFSNGNNTATATGSAWRVFKSTLGASSGKYYAEFKWISDSNTRYAIVGICDEDEYANKVSGFPLAHDMANGHAIYSEDGNYITGGNSTSFGSAFSSTGDGIVGVAMDLDNSKVYFSSNGSWQGGGNPTNGTGGKSITANKTYTFNVNIYSVGSIVYSANYGNGYFGTTAVSSAGSNASGIGIFEYDVPTGYTALSTKGLNL